MKFNCCTAIDGVVTGSTEIDTPLALITINMNLWQRACFMLFTKGRVQLAVSAQCESEKVALDNFCKEYKANG